MILSACYEQKRKRSYETNLASRVIITGKKSELILKEVGL
jgi:hypothetical protein